ncbi:MAG: pantetheine-phosphate adenylyltransferase [Myxococcales bacterium]|nr:pantetheine-phosphate adenylyltransferase [Myxococcales bacterium]
MTIAVYAGTFDPITEGHRSVVQQAARLFTHVRVLVADNPDKQATFSVHERLEMLEEVLGPLPNVSSGHTRGLVVDYARRICANVLVRGIRGASDAAYETDMAAENRRLAPEIATVLLAAEPDLSDVSSSRLKELVLAGEDVSRYCTPEVAQRVRARLLPGLTEV